MIVSDGTFGNKSIKNSGSGTLPKVLRGVYTNNAQAIKSIDLYLVNKVETNAKTVHSGRGK